MPTDTKSTDKSAPASESLYESLGASASKAGLHSALAAAGVADHSGLFAKVNQDLAFDEEYYSFLHCDGAGTKTLAAYLMATETRDPSWFAGLADDALVMNLDDVYCLGKPSALLLANTIARNARIVTDEALQVIINRYRELVESLGALGIKIELSGGETADCGDTVRTLVVDAVLAGRIRKSAIIDPARIVPGDVIVGFSSTGKASYETRNNSGIGSNGLTLARHALMSAYYREKFPEAGDGERSSSNSYLGKYRLTETPAELGMRVGEALLSPTRSYAPILNEVYSTLGPEIHGVIHVTGGGLTKVSRFGPLNNQYVKDRPFPTPPLFKLIQKSAAVSWREMYQVFNMGQRLEIYLPADSAAQVISIASKFQVAAQIIGSVKERNPSLNEPRVVVSSENGEFEY